MALKNKKSNNASDAPDRAIPSSQADMEDTRKGKVAEVGSGGSGRNLLLIGAALVAIVLLGLAWQGGSAPPLNPNGGGANNTTIDFAQHPGAKVLLSSYEKHDQFPSTYQLGFRTVADGMNSEARIAFDGKNYRAILNSPLHENQYYWMDDQTVVCEKSSGNALQCAQTTPQDHSWQQVQSMKASFPQNKTTTLKDRESMRLLIQWGAVRFDQAPRTERMINRSCQLVTYSMDYANLNEDQLAQVQIPAVNQKAFRNFKVQTCVDDQTGLNLFTQTQYEVLGVGGVFYSTQFNNSVIEFDLSSPTLVAPTELVNITKVEAAMSRDREMDSALGYCKLLNTSSERAYCLKEDAVSYNNVAFCKQADDAKAVGDCVVKLATQSANVQPILCEQAGVAKSECYANIAYIKKDISYCGLVEDAELQTLCKTEVGKLVAEQNTTKAS